MSDVETFAIAARLHVVMRRTSGRVTDVEWMTRNRDYAREVVHAAREHGGAELLDLAGKFEVAMGLVQRTESSLRRATAAMQVMNDPLESQGARMVRVPRLSPSTSAAADEPRYIGSLR